MAATRTRRTARYCPARARRLISVALSAIVLGLAFLVGGTSATNALLTDSAVASGDSVSTLGTYEQRVKALNPAGYWRLTESAVGFGATAADASGNGLNGTYLPAQLYFWAQNTGYAGGNGYQYFSLGVNVSYTIQAGDRFEYDILSDVGASQVALELITTTSNLRDGNGGHPDQYGVPSHPAAGSSYSTWTHRSFLIPPGDLLVGSQVTALVMASETDSTAIRAARFTNIRILGADGTIKKTFWGPGDGTPALAPFAVNPSAGSYSVSLGGIDARGPGPLVMYGGSPGAPVLAGNSSGVNLPSPTLDMAGQGAFSVEAWVKSSQLPTLYGCSAFVSRSSTAAQTGATAQYELDQCGGGDGGPPKTQFFVQRPDNTFVVASAPSINDGRWHHLVGVRDGDKVSLYVDGVLAQTVAGAAGSLLPMPAGTPTRIGTRPAVLEAGQGVPGSVAEVAIYKRALTSSEVLDHYKNR